MTTDTTTTEDAELWPDDAAPAPGPGDVTVDIELTKPKEIAYGTATATRTVDGVDFTHTGDFTKDGTRRTFARGSARAFFPLPQREDGEGPGAYAARARAVEVARDAAEGQIGRLLQAEVTRIRLEKQERDREAEEVAAADDTGGYREIHGTPDAPKVMVDVDEHRVITEVIAALAGDPTLYYRGGKLVRVVQGRTAQSGVLDAAAAVPTIAPMPAASLREQITKHATLAQTKAVKGGGTIEVLVHPPSWLVEAVADRGHWPGIRPLAGISDVPVLRPDGTLCQSPGYDAVTGVLYVPSAEFPHVHPDVGIEEAAEAWATLKEVVADFPFEAPEHRAAWLAGLLTVLARFAFRGPAPLFAVDANVAGAGKGLSVDAIGLIALGRNMPPSSYTGDPDELRKMITSVALFGDRVVNLDNVEGPFGNDALDRALTSVTWADRVLGKNEKPELPLTAVWFATGNNLAIAADTARRVIHIKLDVLAERPEDREGFRHPKLRQWIARERPRLLAAALTILVAYCNAGRLDMGLPPYGSFEGWSDLVRQAVVWVGEPDPNLTRVKMVASADTTSDTLEQVLAAFERYDVSGRGILIAEMLGRLYPQDRQYAPKGDDDVAMRSALEQLTNAPAGKTPTARQVGLHLRKFKRRPVGGRMLDKTEKGEHGVRWKIVKLIPALITDCPDNADCEKMS